MARLRVILGFIASILILCNSGSLFARDDLPREVTGPGLVFSHTSAVESASGTYSGTIRVYVVEDPSRWLNDNDQPFRNAFLDFALQEDVSLGEGDSITWEILWDGHDYFDANGQPYDDLQETNIRVIAAVFDSSGYPWYSDPPSGNEFAVHEIDASAEAKCGTTGYNMLNADFTHSILVEYAAAGW